MTATLASQIRGLLLPELQLVGLRIIDEQSGPGFDNAIVTLRSAGVCVRIVRERSQLFVDFAAPNHTESWFDSALIFRLLGLSTAGGFHSSDVKATLGALAGFLNRFYPELATAFSDDQYDVTRNALQSIAAERAHRFDRPNT